MIYESTVDNLLVLMRTVWHLKREQILEFFSNAVDANKVEYFIQQLVLRRVFDYDEEKDIVSYHGAPKFTSTILSKSIEAFWILANFKCENILEINLMAYPSQYMFVTSDNDMYDITYCYMESDANLALKKRKMSLVNGEVDMVNHIALVNNVEDGADFKKYEFDSYCVLNKDKIPEYYTWD